MNLLKQLNKLQLDMNAIAMAMMNSDNEEISNHGAELLGAAGMVTDWIAGIKEDEQIRS